MASCALNVEIQITNIAILCKYDLPLKVFLRLLILEWKNSDLQYKLIKVLMKSFKDSKLSCQPFLLTAATGSLDSLAVAFKIAELAAGLLVWSILRTK